jgi:hypothetical protein
MSRKKITNSELNEILTRIKSIRNLKNNKDVAVLLNISGSDFSNRKKRGTLLPLITQWAIDEKINIEHLLNGDEKKIPPDSCIREEDASYRDKKSVDALLESVRKILNSGNKVAAEVLGKNIQYFARVIETEKKTVTRKK